jgi:hypothetical protein
VPYGLLLVWLAVLYSDDIIELKGTIARYILHCSLHLFIVFWKGCQLKGERERRKNVYLAVAHNRRKIYFETVAALYYRFSHHYARLYPASRLSVLSVAYKFLFVFSFYFTEGRRLFLNRQTGPWADVAAGCSTMLLFGAEASILL